MLILYKNDRNVRFVLFKKTSNDNMKLNPLSAELIYKIHVGSGQKLMKEDSAAR